MKRGAEIEPQVALDEVEQIEARRPCGGLEIRPGAAGKVQHLMVAVGNDIGWRVALGDLRRPAADVAREARRANRRRQSLVRLLAAGEARRQRKFGKHPRRSFEPPEKPVLAVDRREQLLM